MSLVRVPLAAAGHVICAPHLHHDKWSSGGTALWMVGGSGQSIGSTVSDAIDRSWLWSTATWSCQWATLLLLLYYYYIIIIIIIIKRGWQCKAGRERLTPYQSEDPNPKHQPIERKKRKGKQ